MFYSTEDVGDKCTGSRNYGVVPRARIRGRGWERRLYHQQQAAGTRRVAFSHIARSCAAARSRYTRICTSVGSEVGGDMVASVITVIGATFNILFYLAAVSGVSWEEWWTYDGISGPAFWGLINPEWSLCNKGKRQSPVNLEPHKLLFDPNLRSLHIDKHRITGSMGNTGHSVILTVDNTTQYYVNITGGPLSYKYQFQEIHIHYGLHDNAGSEHSINGYMFPAEIQIFGFNSQLYSNFSEALHRSQGIVGISLLLQLGDLSNPELRILTDQLEQIKHGGETVEIKKLSVKGLLPDTDFFMTYDGSTTMPACHETVTWVILNKPIYITKQQLHGLRRLMQGDSKHPKAPLGNNFRPPQPLYHRPVRTNIDFNTKQEDGSRYCPSMYKEVYYKANSWKQH